MSWVEITTEALRQRGRRNSAARRAVIELLGRQPCCVTAQEIFDALRAEGRPVGSDGFVQRVDVGASTSRYEPVQPGGEHHHHLVCADCGKVEAFADPELERALHKVEGQTGYAVAHDVTLRGVCNDCAA
ncbi:MAG: transcriptional repressor [Actinobacteria bacterium]|nr:MAG: transcriptional repressor [Actinomycetota bacterium]